MKRQLMKMARTNPRLRRHVRPVLAAMSREAQLGKALEKVPFEDTEKIWARAFGEALEELLSRALGREWVISTFYGTSGGYPTVNIELEIPREGPFLTIRANFDDPGIDIIGEDEDHVARPLETGVRSTVPLKQAVAKVGRDIVDWALSV